LTTSTTKEWPHIYKALAVFEHLLLHGPESIAEEIKEQLFNLRTLHDFQSIDERGQDKGHAIREKSKKLVEWVTTPSILAEERAKTDALKKKYVGISSEAASTSTYAAGRTYRGNGDGNDEDSFESGRRTSDTLRQQQEALERIERERKEKPVPVNPNVALRSLTPPVATAAAVAYSPASSPPRPSPKPPAATAVVHQQPAPAEDLFDPFAEMAPKKPVPKPPADITDFFSAPPPVSGGGDMFGSNNASDPFASASAFHPTTATTTRATAKTAATSLHPPEVEDDLFANTSPAFGASAPPPTIREEHQDDFFVDSNSSTTIGSSPPPAQQTEKKTLFADTTFDVLCSMDSLAGKQVAKSGASPSAVAKPSGVGMSLKQMRQAGAAQPPQTQYNTTPPPRQQNNVDAFNPFM
jgi:hypothetical protein